MIKPETKEVKELYSTPEEKTYTSISYCDGEIFVSNLDGTILKFSFLVIRDFFVLIQKSLKFQ
jgi:hypothetical protein